MMNYILKRFFQDPGKKALDELKQLIQTALINHEFTSPSPHPKPIKEEEVFLWGIPLIGDEKSDAILLKFLRTRDFKVEEAFTNIKNTVKWRKEFEIETLLDEDLGLSNDLEKAVFMNGFDKEGHPVCYNVYGELESNKDLYSSEEKRLKFLKWGIQFAEKSIRKLDFGPGGVSTFLQIHDLKFLQIHDLKNPPGAGKLELEHSQAIGQLFGLLHDNYPEFFAKHVFINVPWWGIALWRWICLRTLFQSQRTKSKLVFAGSSKSPETLFKYISPEQVPVQYGGLYREGNKEFSCADLAEQILVKPGTRRPIEIPISKSCVVVWEVRVVGWLGEVSYCAEFVPDNEPGDTVRIQKKKFICSSDEQVICNKFKVGEPGKIVLTIESCSYKNKIVFYRSKAN
ncbi:hypothetical protein MKW92_005845 [Papaver armeniacum]|nr:hypothetical protein MKW92_005845 [Papaver armeniacum]